jgi:hypothetical protein
MKEIDLVIEDLELLKSGAWEPDEQSINDSIKNLEKAKENIKKMYSKKKVSELMSSWMVLPKTPESINKWIKENL